MVKLIYSLSRFFHKIGLKVVGTILDKLSMHLFKCWLPGSCHLGKHTKLAYGGIAIVIHENAYIGNHCMIGQGITIGGKNGIAQVPIIEDNVYIGAGARIVGPIRIGHDSIIGPNCVVTKDIPPYSVVSGIPGKVVSIITKEKFEQKYQFYYGPTRWHEDNETI